MKTFKFFNAGLLWIGLQFFYILSLPAEEAGENAKSLVQEADQEKPSKTETDKVPYISLEEAMRLTLMNQRDILISNLEVEKGFGALEETAEPFDPTFDMRLMYDQSRFFQYFPLGLKTHYSQFETTAQLNVFKRSRLGTEFSLSAQVDLVRNRLLPMIVESPAPTTNQGKITFQMTQPLLRNFLYSVDTMREQSALKEAVAEEYDNLQTIAERLFDTIVDYWEVVAAKELLHIQKDAETRLLKLTKEVIALIKEDEIAENDLNQTLQQLAEQKVQVALATQNVTATIENLKDAMGVTDPSGGLLTVCGNFSCNFKLMEDFPPLPAPHKDLCAEEYFWTQVAMNNSFNIVASTIREAAAEDLVIGALNETLPEVDVFGGWSKTNFTLNDKANELFSPLTSGDAQYDTFIGIRISTPLWNDGPVGRYRQREATQQQTVFRTQLLTQDLIRDLRTALNNHVNLWDAVNDSIEAVNKAQILVTNENIKLKEGVSNLFFVVDFENKLTQSLLEKTTLVKQYFQNIAQIRFLTATLLRMGPDMQIVEIGDVLRYPDKEAYCKETWF